MTLFSTNVLFGNTSSTLNATKRTNQQSFHSIEVDGDDSHAIEGTRGSLGNTEGSTKSGVLSFFFGFMFEDPLLLEHEDIDDEILRVKRGHGDLTPPIWNPLNTALFIAYALTTAATAVPVTLISAMADTLLFTDTQKSAFAPRVTGYAVLGTACGKFMLSSLGDIFGARRTAVCFSILLSLSLLALSMCKSATSASWACFFIEVHSSVMMPCIIILLATHYRKYGSAVYEGGIYVISLASRFGVLLGILLSSLLLRRTSWRVVAVVGAWAALIASSVLYLFVKDSPMQKNSPQNPIDPELLAQFSNIQQPTLCNVISLVLAVFQSNVAPSLKHVLKSPAFYIVALAHTGSSAVRTSERILGTYYLDTSLHTLSESTCPTAVWLSVGLISGLVVAGNIYTKGTERQRKRLITKLYISAILSIYVLAFLAIPWLQNKLNAPSLLLIFQLMATFVMQLVLFWCNSFVQNLPTHPGDPQNQGFSIAVQLYHIPSLVGATFGADKGLYSGYTDGFAYALSSLVWRFVGNSVQNDESGVGWAYGWAAVALILIVSAIFMVEFMEHYFVRPGVRTAAGYETIMFA